MKKININEGNKSHEEWLEKFNKTKEGKILNMVYDVQKMKLNHRNFDTVSYLCSALFISACKTKHIDDSIRLINLLCPSFFSDFNANTLLSD